MQKCLQFTCKRKEKGATCIPSYFTAKWQNGQCSFYKWDGKNGIEKNEQSVVHFHHEENAAGKQEQEEGQKSSALKGLGPLSHPSPLSLDDAYGSNAHGDRSSENPLSPFEGPTVCQGAQGAQ